MESLPSNLAKRLHASNAIAGGGEDGNYSVRWDLVTQQECA